MNQAQRPRPQQGTHLTVAPTAACARFCHWCETPPGPAVAVAVSTARAEMWGEAGARGEAPAMVPPISSHSSLKWRPEPWAAVVSASLRAGGRGAEG